MENKLYPGETQVQGKINGRDGCDIVFYDEGSWGSLYYIKHWEENQNEGNQGYQIDINEEIVVNTTKFSHFRTEISKPEIVYVIIGYSENFIPHQPDHFDVGDESLSLKPLNFCIIVN